MNRWLAGPSSRTRTRFRLSRITGIGGRGGSELLLSQYALEADHGNALSISGPNLVAHEGPLRSGRRRQMRFAKVP